MEHGSNDDNTTSNTTITAPRTAVSQKPTQLPAGMDIDEEKVKVALEQRLKTGPSSSASAPGSEYDSLLFAWISRVNVAIRRIPQHDVAQVQTLAEDKIIRFLFSREASPSRAFQAVACRVLVYLYACGTASPLFHHICQAQEILKGRKTTEENLRVVSAFFLGKLLANYGSQFVSLLPNSINCLYKLVKTTRDITHGLRYECLIALSEILLQVPDEAGVGMPPKDIYKATKPAIYEKTPTLLRIGYLELLSSILDQQLYIPFSNSDDVVSFLLPLTGFASDENRELNKAIVMAITSVLQSTQAQIPIKGKHSSKSAQNSSQPQQQSNQTGAQGSQAKLQQNILSLQEMFSLFTKLYNKVNTDASRVVIVDSYISLIKESGPQFVETNHPEIIDSILIFAKKTQSETSIKATTRSRVATGLILREGVSKILGEVGQLKILHYLIRNYLDKWTLETDPLADTPFVDEHILICIFNEISVLVSDLGEAAPIMENSLIGCFMNIMEHPSKAVITHMSYTMLAFFTVFPFQIPVFISKSMRTLQKEMPSALNSQLHHESFLNHGLVLSTLIRAISFKKLYISYSTMANIFGLASHILKITLSSKNPKLILKPSQVAWRLLSSLMNLGPDFIGVHMPQLLLICKSVFQKPPPANILENMSAEDKAFILISKDSALTFMYSFCKNYAKVLSKSDSGKRVAVCLNNTLLFISSISQTIGPNTTTPTAGTSTTNLATPSTSTISASTPDDAYITADYVKPDSAGSWPLESLENSVRRKLFMCYELLNPPKMFNMSHAFLLKEAIKLFSLDGKDDFISGTDTIGGLGQRLLLISNAHELARSTYTTDSNGSTSLLDTVEKSKSCANGLLLLDGYEYATSTITDCPGPLEADPLKIFLYDEKISSSEVDGFMRFEPLRSYPTFIDNCTKAIDIFAMLFPLQPGSRQEKISELLARLATHAKGRSPQKLLAIQINILLAFNRSLDNVIAERGNITSMQMIQITANLSSSLLVSVDPVVRCLAADLLGKLCRIADSSQFHSYVFSKWINLIVTNTGPFARAGAAIALGTVVNNISGLSAHSHLDQIVSVLDSLARDSHPLVHTWALHSLNLVIDGAGLMFRPYIESTFQLLGDLIISAAHQTTADEYTEGGPHRTNTLVSALLCRCLYSIVGIIGPDLEFNDSQRETCINLYEYFKGCENIQTLIETLKCNQQFIMFAPQAIDKQSMIPFLRLQLTSSNDYEEVILRRASITCLYQISQVDPNSLLKADNADFNLEEQIFFMLDLETKSSVRKEIKHILKNFLNTVCVDTPSKWLDLCKGILLKTGGSAALEKEIERGDRAFDQDENGSNFSDDASENLDSGSGLDSDNDSEAEPAIYDTDMVNEVELAAAAQKEPEPAPVVVQDPQEAARMSLLKMAFKMLVPRWHTHLFALQCVRDVLDASDKNGVKEHFDMIMAVRANHRNKPKRDFLVLRLNDLIRTAFTAATSTINVLRLGGFSLLSEIIAKFKYARDPHFHSAALLEQYQAQIAASLTPAMNINCHPEVLSKACTTAAAYVGSGITEDVDALSRVLRMLNALLEKFSDPTMVESLQRIFTSPNLEIMVKVSLLTAWAQLQNTSFTYSFLESVTGPYLEVLSDLWIQHLVWYGILKINLSATDILHRSIGDLTYIEATRNLLMPIYEDSWIHIMTAVMSIGARDPVLFEKTLLGTQLTGPVGTASDDEHDEGNNHSSFIAEPNTKYKAVYIIYGLCFQCLGQNLVHLPRLKIKRPQWNTNLAEVAELERIENSILSSIKTMCQLISNETIATAFIGSQILLETVYLVARYNSTYDIKIKLAIIELFTQINRSLESSTDGSYGSATPASPTATMANLETSDRVDILSTKGVQFPLHVFVMLKVLFSTTNFCVESSRGVENAQELEQISTQLAAGLGCLTEIAFARQLSDVSGDSLEKTIPVVLYMVLYIALNKPTQGTIASRLLVATKDIFARLSNITDDQTESLRPTCTAFVNTLLEISERDLNLCRDDSSNSSGAAFRSSWLLATCAISFAPNVALNNDIRLKVTSILQRYILETSKINTALLFKALQMLSGVSGDYSLAKDLSRGEWIAMTLDVVSEARIRAATLTLTERRAFSLSLQEITTACNNILVSAVASSAPPSGTGEEGFRLAVVGAVLLNEVATVQRFLAIPEDGSVTKDVKLAVIRNCNGSLVKKLTETHADAVRAVVSRLDESQRRFLQVGLM